MSHIKFTLSFQLLLSIQIYLLKSSSSGNHEQFLYTGFTNANLTPDGTAKVVSSGLLAMTKDALRTQGHAFHPSPVRFRQSPNGTVQSFSLSFVFEIIPSIGDVRGHGIAFVITPSTNFFYAFPIQFLGLLNDNNYGSMSNHIFAIELDTIQNIEFGDIDNNHVGIDINSLNSISSSTSGFYDEKNGTLREMPLIGRGAIQVWMDYGKRDTHINVSLAPLGKAKPVKPLLSITYDLSAVLTDQAYIGFSSSTGLSTGHHYVLGWSFGLNSSAPAIDSTKLPTLPHLDLDARPHSKHLAIILPVASGVFVLVVAIAVVVRRHLIYKEVLEDWEVEYRPHMFSYTDLYYATKGFSTKHLIGTGGFGRVYKGVLPTSKSKVAIKRVRSDDSKQGMKEFIAEIVSIGYLQHRNLVGLLGYCRQEGELLLVYDYMEKGSLDKYSHGQEGRPTINWKQRFQIIKDIASGLLYLHEEWDKVVIHRDIKASNVLLDKDMNGRLGDFGLARLCEHGTNPQTTRVVGMVGYLAPELVHTGKATRITDVFGFGIFILEVTSGKRPITQDTDGNQFILVDSVFANWFNKSLLDIVDANLQGNYTIDEACLALKLGLLCSHPFPNARPNMRQVMQYLDGDMPLPELKPSHFQLSHVALVENKGFNSFAMDSHP